MYSNSVFFCIVDAVRLRSVNVLSKKHMIGLNTEPRGRLRGDVSWRLFGDLLCHWPILIPLRAVVPARAASSQATQRCHTGS